ncbi:MAG: hypothetical protein OZ921_11570 [Sorangiineae bacterium]|nr:hypothetical protein [Polyangiaceae bacterium]MEB2323145.1 hypothetical protein [Sorangiineae bacterium]
MMGPSTLRVPLAPFAAITLSSLALEVFLVRVLAYTVQTFLVYLVLGVAMIGFGAASSLVAVRRRWLEPEHTPVVIAAWAFAYPVSIVVAYAAFARLGPLLDANVAALTFLGAALLTLPFLTSGAVVTLALASAGPRVGRAYAADLLGAGLGCLAPLLLVERVGGERLLALLALVGWVGALGFLRAARARPRWLGWLAAASLGLTALALAVAPRVFAFQPEPHGQVGLIQRQADRDGFGMRRVYDRWNMTGRVEVYAFDRVPGGPHPYPYLFYAQDSTAGAMMARWDGRDESQAPLGDVNHPVPALCGETVFASGYSEHRDDVLVIGVGGGVDVECALYHRARRVDAVEINPASISAIRGPFNRWLGGIGRDPRVAYHLRDGRSFARGARPASYDLVQLSGVDTKSMLSTGALALSENHLFTAEAFRDYLTSLKPDGVLTIIRFGEAEALRLAATAVAALGELGEPRPEGQVVVLRNARIYGVIVRRSGGWDAARLSALGRRFWFHDRPFRGADIRFFKVFGFRLSVRPVLVYAPGEASDPEFLRFFSAVKEGTLARFAESYPANLAPATDDRPFFFDTTRYDRAQALEAPHVRVLIDMLASVVVLAAGLVLLPVWAARRREERGGGFVTLTFFGCVGLAYLFLEIWFLQRLAMFLGHQTYALGAVLGTLLVSTGAGAALGARSSLSPRQRIWLGVVGTILVVLAWRLLLPPLFARAWGASLPVKMLWAVVFVAPAGLAMGQPFPAGLAWLAARRPTAVAWSVGINFFASVLATTVAVPASLLGGYQLVSALGVSLYVVAAVAAVAFREPGAEPV